MASARKEPHKTKEKYKRKYRSVTSIVSLVL
jgi:hypothetical protein